jgi:TPR repeat protein
LFKNYPETLGFIAGGGLKINAKLPKRDRESINIDKSLEYYERSAQLGNNIALNNLGVIYSRGLHVRQDYGKGRKYYEKCDRSFLDILVLKKIYKQI